MENRAEFTNTMRRTHTIYMPDMLHAHNTLLCAAFRYGGYRLRVVPEYTELSSRTASIVGKDYCTCAHYIVGNLLEMLERGDCDPRRTAFLEPQTGGACRAGNYYPLILESLKKTGHLDIPVISLNMHGEQAHSGFCISPRLVLAAEAAVCYSDLLMTLTQQLRPYELVAGTTLRLRARWLRRLSRELAAGRSICHRPKVYEEIVQDFSKIRIDRSIKKKKVGVAGEIYIKFSPIGNRHLEDFLAEQQCDYRMGGFLNYCIYILYSEITNRSFIKKSRVYGAASQAGLDHLCRVQRQLNECLRSRHFLHDGAFYDLKRKADGIMSDAYNIGDGWLMTAEVMDLIEQGYDRILMVHPFGCLVSHVGIRGVIGQIKKKYPKVRISSVEFDYEQSDALLQSRLLLGIG